MQNFAVIVKNLTVKFTKINMSDTIIQRAVQHKRKKSLYELI